MLAAKLGACVCMTDRSDRPDILANCVKMFAANGLTEHTQAVPLTWGEFTPVVAALPPFDIVLGSDIFYDSARACFWGRQPPHASYLHGTACCCCSRKCVTNSHPCVLCRL